MGVHIQSQRASRGRCLEEGPEQGWKRFRDKYRIEGLAQPANRCRLFAQDSTYFLRRLCVGANNPCSACHVLRHWCNQRVQGSPLPVVPFSRSDYSWALALLGHREGHFAKGTVISEIGAGFELEDFPQRAVREHVSLLNDIALA